MLRLSAFLLFIAMSSQALALTFKSGESIQSSNTANADVAVSKTIDGNCKLDLPVPNETKPVNFDISGFCIKRVLTCLIMPALHLVNPMKAGLIFNQLQK